MCDRQQVNKNLASSSSRAQMLREDEERSQGSTEKRPYCALRRVTRKTKGRAFTYQIWHSKFLDSKGRSRQGNTLCVVVKLKVCFHPTSKALFPSHGTLHVPREAPHDAGISLSLQPPCIDGCPMTSTDPVPTVIYSRHGTPLYEGLHFTQLQKHSSTLQTNLYTHPVSCLA